MSSSCNEDEQSDCTSDYEYEYVDEDEDEEELEKEDRVTRVVEVLVEKENFKLPCDSREARRPELGVEVGSICTRCHGEAHRPAQDCDTVQAWMAKRYQLPTVDRAYIVSCFNRFLREAAARFDISIDQAGILCRRYQWDLDRIARTGGQQGAPGMVQCVQCKIVATRNFFYKKQWQKRDSPMGAMCIPCQYVYTLPDDGKFMCTQCNMRKQPDEFAQQRECTKEDKSIYMVCTACESQAKKPPPLDICKEAQYKCILCMQQKKAGHFNYLEWKHEESDMMLCQSCWDILPFPSLGMRNRLQNATPVMVREVRQNARRLSFGRKVGRLTPARDEVVTLGHMRNNVQRDLKPPPADQTYSCDVCLNDELPYSDMMGMECGHVFCRDCWRAYIQVQLEEANLETTCPTALCAIRVTELQIEQVAPELLPTFETMNLQSFVQANAESLQVCPGPECDAIAVQPRLNLFEDDDAGFYCRACQTSFCFHCGAAPHAGRPCVQQDVVVENEAVHIRVVDNVARLEPREDWDRFDGEDQTNPELGVCNNDKEDKQMKQCPSCKVDIQKIGGCNRMTCKCGYHFCWICLGEYKSYGSHFCGRPAQEAPRIIDRIDINLSYVRRSLEEEDTNIIAANSDFQQQMKELEHYAHFYNRFYVHGESQRFAELQCPCLQERVNDYTRMADIKSGTDIDFIRKANETLVASRRLLKYTYCSAYNYHEQHQLESLGSNNGSDAFAHLGFLQLELLERFTEELSEVTEHAVTRRDRTRVLDLISIVTKCMEAVADFEKFT